MSERSRLIGETLNRLGTLQWIRLSGGKHPVYGYYQVPFLGVRFEIARREHLRLIERAVRDTPTSEGWIIDASRRNWLLAPSAILEGGDNPAASPGFDESVESAMLDQDFCIRALADFDAIIRTLRDLIAESENSGG
ncbi:hypothetical protein ACFY7C_26805 [Streptomyces sp. NPDC012769]|uniref:hypothetical protein n=1 Tax=Streptomyces sp. NPDC012769 TaxID=3364848 RepID=UPI00368057FF